MTYPWTRFLVPRDGKVNLDADGFLHDPEGDFGYVYNPDLITMDEASEKPVLVIFGEPGSGKSHELKDLYDRTRVREICVHVDLRSYGNEQRLVQRLFESDDFRLWTQNHDPLYLFLDSYDECLINLGYLSSLLAQEFDLYEDKRNLYLRLACRTGAWQISLENAFLDQWGKEHVGIYELAPLRRKDISVAAECEKLTADAFLQEIEMRQVSQLATQPITLFFLIKTFREHGALPTGRIQLYEGGCLSLCEEPNERTEAGHGGQLSSARRLNVSCRIAAALVFCGRESIYLGAVTSDRSRESIHIQELAGKEIEGGVSISITEEELRETLTHTGLFSARGVERMGFVHRTYAEFLAARYVSGNRFPKSEISKLLNQADGSGSRLIPQLYGVAGWLAAMDGDICEEILTTDPEVLLDTDEIALDHEKRAGIVTGLLERAECVEWTDSDWGVRKHYRKLDHPNLSEQLRPYVRNKEKFVVTRRVAIDICEACHRTDLLDDLVSVTLDESEDYQIRKQAADAVLECGSTAHKQQLRPLAFGGAGDDPDDELRGAALRALWPDHFSTKDLEKALRTPNSGFYGNYWVFLEYELVPGLEADDLPFMLEWTTKLGRRIELEHVEKTVLNKVMQKAWTLLGHEEVLQAFAKAAWDRLKKHDGIFGDLHREKTDRELLSEDYRKRRLLLDALLFLVKSPDKAIWRLVKLVSKDDVPWLLERLCCESNDTRSTVLAKLIAQSFDREDSKQVSLVLDAADEDDYLKEALGWLLNPVMLDSEDAREQREWHQDMIASNHEKKQPVAPPPAERIRICLDRCEAGNVEAWEGLELELMLEEDSQYYNFPKSNLKDTPGWQQASAKIRARITNAAKAYLESAHPSLDELFAKTSRTPSLIAGTTALFLLQKENPEYLVGKPPEFWQKWSPVLLDPYFDSDREKDESHKDLLRLAYDLAPDAILGSLERFLDFQIKETNHLSVRYLITHIWDHSVETVLLRKIRTHGLGKEPFRELLSTFLIHGSQQAIRFAEEIVTDHNHSVVGEPVDRAIVAADLLLTHANNGGWPVIWPTIQHDAEFGKKLFLHFASPSGHSARCQNLNDKQLGDLFEWLSEQFPRHEDGKRPLGRVHGVIPRLEVGAFRDHIIVQREERGTEEACRVLADLSSRYDEQDWIKWRLQNARRKYRERTWMPPSPSDFLAIVSDPQRRLVRSASELMDVATESLHRLQVKLHGVTPEVQFLWDELDGGFRRPKSEPVLSDFIKIHLTNDLKGGGIVANREVEVSRPSEGGVGERTDIYVSAISEDGSGARDVAVVVIECKGCWNPRVFDDIDTQLKKQYLKDEQHRHGLYVVGWYQSERWDKRNGRFRGSCRKPYNQLEKELRNRTAEACGHEIVIKAFLLDARF